MQQINDLPTRIPTREEFMRMKQNQDSGSQAGQAPQGKIPTREEFMAMKRLGIAPRAEEAFSMAGMRVNELAPDIPTRAEFLAMKQAGEVPSGDGGILDYAKNAALGFAARGNQAMTALNPFATQADYDRIAAEKAWMEQHSGSGLGEVLADIAITAPAGGVGSLAGRALGTGALEGLTTPGGTIDKIKEAGYMALSSGLGEGVANLVGRAIHPFRASAETKPLVQAAEKMGINLNAAQRTGNKALQYADSALDTLPFSSGPQAAAKKLQRQAWQKQVLGQAGEYADTATPEVMGALKDRLSGVYNDIASRNVINIDSTLKADLKQVSDQYLTRLPTTQKGIVKSYLNDFTKMGKLPASAYQDARSMLDKQARAFANSDPATAQALLSIRSAMDNAFQRSVSPEDYANLIQANKEWGIMRTIEKAIDPATDTLSPKKLMNEVTRRNKSGVIYGRGDQSLAELARVGKSFIGETLPDSGTAQRSYMMDLLKGSGLIGAAGGYYGSDGDIGAALQGAGMGMLGTVIVPRLASRMMQNPNGYLSKGLIDLTEGMRSQILSEMGRNAGIGMEHLLTAKHPRKDGKSAR